MQFRAVKGMNDLLPTEIGAWHRLEAAFARQARLYGFEEIRTPLLEPTQLFVRSMGEVTDVVQKEMYTLERSGEQLALRPEGTAGAARAYVQNTQQAKEPVTRWYYTGPMFRAERPQRGRLRQFHQSGCEIYGDPGPVCDAELITLLSQLFGELGIQPLQVKVNSIGGADSRKRYRAALVDYLEPRREQLSELSQQRLATNPLRVLDSKNEADQQLLLDAPSTLDSLTAEDRTHFEQLCGALAAFDVPYEVDTKLVRGIDYYTRTVFEIQTNAGNLGAQNTIAAGGRYDGLVSELGGPAVPAVGFAMGLERILLAMPEMVSEPDAICSILPLGGAANEGAAQLANALRKRQVRVDLDARDNSLKSKLRRANTLGASLVVMIGDTELERGVVQVKDLINKTQSEHPALTAAQIIAEQLTRMQQAGQRAAAPAEPGA